MVAMEDGKQPEIRILTQENVNAPLTKSGN